MYIQCNGTPFVSTIDYVGPHILSTTANISHSITLNIPPHIIDAIPNNIPVIQPHSIPKQEKEKYFLSFLGLYWIINVQSLIRFSS